MLGNLKKLREENEVSQRRLAEAIGVSQQSINKYENHNIEPDICTLIKIADYFNTSVDYLVGHTDIKRKIEEVTEYQLNNAESKLIDEFRRLTEKQKLSINLVIENFNELIK